MIDVSDDENLVSLEILGIFSERLLGPLGYKVHQLSVATHLLVKCGVLISGQHFILFGEFKL